MYCPSSPSLNSPLDNNSNGLVGYHNNQNGSQLQFGLNRDTTTLSGGGYIVASNQCIRFKYFTTFLICTTCLALLSASLATHKWLISKPIRILKLNGGQTNITSLILTAHDDEKRSQSEIIQYNNQHNTKHHLPSSALLSSLNSGLSLDEQQEIATIAATKTSHNNKFQGEIYFGLFQGVKVLNHGFGDRVSPISVIQTLFARDNNNSNQQEIINFKLWLSTLVSVSFAILFSLIGSIFAIINFVMTPRGKLTGPIGLVIWNSIACFSCLLAMVSWLVEYFVRLKTNVLTLEEVQNGWTSENRSQFGYSYYFVTIAFVLFLVNIFIISIVHFETWTSNGSTLGGVNGSGFGSSSIGGNNKLATKRHSRPVCEGVIMLY